MTKRRVHEDVAQSNVCRWVPELAEAKAWVRDEPRQSMSRDEDSLPAF